MRRLKAPQKNELLQGKAVYLLPQKLERGAYRNLVPSRMVRFYLFLRNLFRMTGPAAPFFVCVPIQFFPDNSQETSRIIERVPDLHTYVRDLGLQRIRQNRVETLGNWATVSRDYITPDRLGLVSVTVYAYCISNGSYFCNFAMDVTSVASNKVIVSSNRLRHLEVPGIEHEREVLHGDLGQLLDFHWRRIKDFNAEFVTNNKTLKKYNSQVLTCVNDILNSELYQSIDQAHFESLLNSAFAEHCPRCGGLRAPEQRYWAADKCLECAEKELKSKQEANVSKLQWSAFLAFVSFGIIALEFFLLRALNFSTVTGLLLLIVLGGYGLLCLFLSRALDYHRAPYLEL